MKILSIEESKQIATKFLKHIGKYNKEEVERYFSKKSLILRLPIISFFAQLFIKKYREYNKEIYSIPLSWPVTKGQVQKYEDFLCFHDLEYKFFTDKEFFKTIQKTLKKHNINRLFAISPIWNFYYGKLIYKHAITFSVDELDKEQPPLFFQLARCRPGYCVLFDTCIFSEDFSFLFILSTEFTADLFGPKEFISDFKSNYPNYIKYLNMDEMKRVSNLLK
ncbi:MAG: hypothetical protein AB1465_07330 [Patescibacteria group bacterium]